MDQTKSINGASPNYSELMQSASTASPFCSKHGFVQDWHGEAGLLQEAATREQLQFLIVYSCGPLPVISQGKIALLQVIPIMAFQSMIF